jgi:hypothetical protein
VRIDGKITEQLELIVEEAVFDKPLDEKAFTFRGLNLHKDTLVIITTEVSSKYYRWDGDKLVPVELKGKK